MRDCELEVAQRLVLCCRELYRVRGRWPLPGKHGCHNRKRLLPYILQLYDVECDWFDLSRLYSMCDVYH